MQRFLSNELIASVVCCDHAYCRVQSAPQADSEPRKTQSKRDAKRDHDVTVLAK